MVAVFCGFPNWTLFYYPNRFLTHSIAWIVAKPHGLDFTIFPDDNAHVNLINPSWRPSFQRHPQI